jgi:PKD repeat protein
MANVYRWVALASVVLSAACSTSQTTAPPLAGPSEFALSLRMTATPDSLSQDGASQSSIQVQAFGPNGNTLAGIPLRVDMGVNGVVQDYGTLSARTIVTGSDGRATTVYTAPPPPPASAGGGSTVVTLLATPTGTDYTAANPQIVTIRLVPPGVVLPPANTPTARFTFPSPVNAGVNTLFDGSSSCPRGVDSSNVCLPPSGAGASITNYSWSFGDGGSATGQTATHVFRSVGTFTVTLTVTNDRGATGSSSQSVQVQVVDKPSVDFVWSPQPVLVRATTSFNAGATTAAAGHQITNYSWDFGDGTSGSGLSVTHAFGVAQTYKVVLTVTDDTGQQASTSKDIAVLTGNPIPAFVSSPGIPTSRLINFDASTSQSFGGATITTYSWNFGDGTTASTSSPLIPHTFAASIAYTVSLTVTDSLGRSATTTVSVTAP